MLKHSPQCALFKGMLLIGTIAASSCSSRYPIDVCRCSEIDIANVYQVFLVDKNSSVVVLEPSVALVKKISPEAVVLSNLKSQELIENPNDPGHRYWEPFGTPNTTEEGYFLHQCDKEPLLVPLGMDREKAIARALELVKESQKDASEQKEQDEGNGVDR